MNSRSWAKRTALAFTLVEMFIVMLIVAILVSILLVGVQSVRENARVLECQNNIRQSVLSLSNITSRTGSLPKIVADEVKPKIPGQMPVFVNPFVILAREMSIPGTAIHGKIRVDNEAFGESFPPSVFRCPSSDNRLGYRFNFGVKPKYQRGTEDQTLFSRRSTPFRLAEAVDGTSYTAAISERFSFDESSRFPTAIVSTDLATSFEDMDGHCVTGLRDGSTYRHVGQWWGPNVHDCGYDHTKSPNDRQVDCVAFVNHGPLSQTFLVSISARSRHSGGVSVGYLDSSVRWINSGIDLNVWHAMGTFDGKEVVADD